MKRKLYFVTGVCGVGKSTIIPHLRELLPKDQYNIRDFDERGVPDGADHEWRKREVMKWLEVAEENIAKDMGTVICGFAKETDLPTKAPVSVEFILLDATSDTIRQRLTNRYSKNGLFDETQKVIGKPVTEFIESNVYYCDVMRKEHKGEVVDTSNISPKEVAEKIVAILLDL